MALDSQALHAFVTSDRTHGQVNKNVMHSSSMMLKVRIGERSILALLDSGSMICIIRPEAVPQNARLENFRTEIQTFGTARYSTNRACQLDVDFGVTVQKIRFVICPRLSTMMILGSNWMIKSKVAVDFSAKVLKLPTLSLPMVQVSSHDFMMSYYAQTDRQSWNPLPNSISADFVNEIRIETRLEDPNREELKKYIDKSQKIIFRDGLIQVVQEKCWSKFYVPTKLRNALSEKYRHMSVYKGLCDNDLLKVMSIHFFWPRLTVHQPGQNQVTALTSPTGTGRSNSSLPPIGRRKCQNIRQKRGREERREQRQRRLLGKTISKSLTAPPIPKIILSLKSKTRNQLNISLRRRAIAQSFISKQTGALAKMAREGKPVWAIVYTKRQEFGAILKAAQNGLDKPQTSEQPREQAIELD